jgi:hypothetical protein
MCRLCFIVTVLAYTYETCQNNVQLNVLWRDFTKVISILYSSTRDRHVPAWARTRAYAVGGEQSAIATAAILLTIRNLYESTYMAFPVHVFI